MHHFRTEAARAYEHAGAARRAFVRARALMNVARVKRARGDVDGKQNAARNARMIVRAGRAMAGYAREVGVEVPS